MMNGRNNGKKLMAVRIVAHAFEIVRIPWSFWLRYVSDIQFLYGQVSLLAMFLTYPFSSDPHHDRPEPHPGRRRRYRQLRSS